MTTDLDAWDDFFKDDGMRYDDLDVPLWPVDGQTFDNNASFAFDDNLALEDSYGLTKQETGTQCNVDGVDKQQPPLLYTAPLTAHNEHAMDKLVLLEE